MKWFKHDTNANMDSKLQEVLLDYGLEGYGLYWYCIELISSKVDKDNITFAIEHDARIIARNTGSTVQKVNEMMNRFVELNLFENTDGIVTCMKLARRLDQSMTSNPEMRGIINKVKNHDSVMTKSEIVMQDKIRLEEIRVDKSIKTPYQLIVDVYHEELKDLSRVVIISDKRKAAIKKLFNYHEDHKDINWWKEYFQQIKRSDFLMGRSVNNNNNHHTWTCDFDFIINMNNFIKIIEGKYL